MYKHLLIKEKTKTRFDNALLQIKIVRNPEQYTQDNFLNALLDEWEQKEAGVKP